MTDWMNECMHGIMTDDSGLVQENKTKGVHAWVAGVLWCDCLSQHAVCQRHCVADAPLQLLYQLIEAAHAAWLLCLETPQAEMSMHAPCQSNRANLCVDA